MNIEKLIHDLRARINPQYYDQIGTESYERNQCVMAMEYLQQENERQHFDILAMNQSLDLLREENERLRKDAERIEWQPIETAPKDEPILVGPTKRMGICVAMYCGYDGWVTETCVEWVSIYTPTHWMQLPKPPK